MIGIKFKWECPNCGAILSSQEPFSTKKLMKAAVSEKPSSCSCGWKGDFKILTFEQCEYMFKEKEE